MLDTESTAGPYESRHEGKRVDIIYATFTTPSNALSGSAVCAFRLHDVEKVFDGAFKEQAALNYNWLPVPAHKVDIFPPSTHFIQANNRSLKYVKPRRDNATSAKYVDTARRLIFCVWGRKRKPQECPNHSKCLWFVWPKKTYKLCRVIMTVRLDHSDDDDDDEWSRSLAS